MKNLLLFFSFLSLSVLSLAQPSTAQIAWEARYGGAGDDTILDLIQDNQGRLLFTGTIEKTAVDNNLMLGIVNEKDGQLFMPLIEIDKGGHESGQTMRQTHDGSYAIGGYSEGKKASGRDALFCQIDENGRILLDTILISTAGEDSFEDIIEDVHGNIYLIGKINGHLGIAKWTRDKLLSTIISEREPVKMAPKAALGADGEVYVIGQITGDAFVIYRADFDGNKFQEIGTVDGMQATDLLTTTDGHLLISGFASGINREDVCLTKVSTSGEVLWQKTFGGRGNDLATSVYEQASGEYLVAGSSNSYAPGAGRTKFYLNCIDPMGNNCWEGAFYYGGNEADEANTIVQLRNGNLVLAGFSKSKFKKKKAQKKDACLFKLATKGIDYIKRDLNLSVDGGCRIEGEDSNQVLSPGERAFLSFLIKNNSPVDVHGASLYIEKDHLIEGIIIPDSLFIGSIKANGEKWVFLPVIGSSDLRTGSTRLNIRVGNPYMYLKETTRLVGNCKIESIGKARPHLSFVSDLNAHTVASSRKSFTLHVQAKNDGNAQVSNVIMEYLPQGCGIHPIGEASATKADLAPGELMEHTFHFTLDKDYLGAFAPFKFRVYSELGGNLEASILDTIRLDTPYYPPLAENEDIAIHLVSPSEKLYCDYPLIEKREYIDVKGLIVSRSPFPNNICRSCKVILNEAKAKGGMVSRLPDPIVVDGLYYYDFEQKQIYLQEGYKNSIHLEVKKNDQVIQSEIAYVKAIPIDLHLISIGVPSDLRYTTNDADSIAEAFQRQEGRFYRSVNVKKLNTVAATTKINIASALEGIVGQYNKGEIDTTDMLILFISSHGEVAEQIGKSFRIVPSNYNAEKKIATSLGYKEDIIDNYLSQIKCKKLILIDACHSGGKGGYISETLNQHMKKPAGTVTLSSCKANQKAYECQDNSCDNGIFTQAILDAMNGQMDLKEIDANDTGTVELSELYEHLIRSVPKMAAQEYTFKPVQVPTISKNHKKLEWDSLTLFVY